MAYQPIPVLVGGRLPNPTDDAVAIATIPQRKLRFGFGRVYASGVDPAFGAVVPPLGTGMTIAQQGGALVLTSGVTPNQDAIVRSNTPVQDNFTLRWSTVLSQRIAGQSFVVELVDVLGDGLAATILSATSIRVTMPGHPWDDRNVGQSVTLGDYTGSGALPGGSNAVIAAISGDQVTFTIAGATAGSGTVSVFGWNYHRFTYDGTTATTMKYRSQRGGWPGVEASVTINTTAGVGHIGILNVEDNVAAILDQLRASTTGIQATSRGSGIQDMPDDDVPLYLQLRMTNTATPASSTTWTVAFVDTEVYVPQQVSATSVRAQSMAQALPVQVQNPTVTASPTTPGVYKVVSAASTNFAVITASTSSGRRIFNAWLFNPTAATVYVKFYSKTTAPVSTDVPVVTVPVPAGALVTLDGGQLGNGGFSGIGIGITAGAAANDNTAVAAGVQVSVAYGA